MNQFSWSDLRKSTSEEMISNVPFELTVNGIPVLVVDKPENIITLSDLHPRIRIQLKASERKARLGMPHVKKVFVDDIREQAKAEAS